MVLRSSGCQPGQLFPRPLGPVGTVVPAGPEAAVSTARNWVGAVAGIKAIMPRLLLGSGSLAAERGGQVVAWMACRMTQVTTPGSEIIDKCGAFTSVMRACAFSAMASCSAGGMPWSAVTTTAHDGLVCQAGMPDGSVRALVAMGSCVTPSTCASPAGRLSAMHDGNSLWVM